MIKKKNKLILTLFFMSFVIALVILINNKNVKIKTSNNENKKYEKIYRLFYNEGYSTGLKDYLSKVNDDKKIEACNYTKELASEGNETDRLLFNSECVGKVTGFDEQLEFTSGNNSCEQLKTIIENDYVAYWRTYVDIYKPKCMEELGFSDIKETKPYYKDVSKCETLKLVDKNKNLYTGILKPNGSIYGEKNTCKNRIFYYEGYATSLDDYLKKVDDEKKIEACKYTKSLAEAGNTSDMDDYNKHCSNISGFSEIEKHYIIFKAQDGYGIECPKNYTVPAYSVCTYTFYSNKNDNSVKSLNIDLPDVIKTNKDKDKNIYHGLYQIGTYYKFSYWSKDSNCKTRDIERNQTTLNINSINNEGTYYACYDETDDNTIEDITDIYHSCDAASDYQATLTSTIKSTDSYTTNSNANESITKSNKTYTINKYCPMKCSETFTYTYPSIFETVKSGTYFQLIYTPQVKSTYTCTETYNYALWESDYNTAIENEKKAYVDKLNAESINAISSIGIGVESSDCDTYTSGETTHHYKKYKISVTPKKYFNGTISDDTTDVYASKCETRNNAVQLSDLKDQLYDKINQQLNTTQKLSVIKNNPSKTYDEEKGKRNALEEKNKTCYETLSESKVSTDNFYTVKPSVKMVYESDTTMNQDAGLTTSDPYYKKDSIDRSDEKKPFTISYGDVNETKQVYTFGTDHVVTRTKKVNYEFHTNYDYYANFYTGSINSSNNGIKLGNVFPVKIASSGKRNIEFIMDTTNSTLSGNVKDILNSGDNATYTCNYNITNDAVVLDKETKDETENKKKYKTTFFVRPIATNDVDPNNRLDKGLLGANWSSTKGQALMKIIEDKSKNQNTYNPNNLEYSFTLNAESLDKIRDYNKNHKYDEKIDTYFKCNGLGMECESEFLNELLKGTYGNVNGSISNGRDTRKYYIGGKWYSTDSLLSNKDFVEVSSGIKHSKSEVYGICKSSCNSDDVSACYDCLYRKVNGGVTP